MARRTQEIKVISYVHRGDELVCTDNLTQEEKEKVGVQIRKTLLNAMWKKYGVEAVTQEEINAALAAGEEVILVEPDGSLRKLRS